MKKLIAITALLAICCSSAFAGWSPWTWSFKWGQTQGQKKNQFSQGAAGGIGFLAVVSSTTSATVLFGNEGAKGSAAIITVSGLVFSISNLTGQGASGGISTIAASGGSITNGLSTITGQGAVGGASLSDTYIYANLTPYPQGAVGSNGIITASGLVFASSAITGQGAVGSNGTLTASSSGGSSGVTVNIGSIGSVGGYGIITASGLVFASSAITGQGSVGGYGAINTSGVVNGTASISGIGGAGSYNSFSIVAQVFGSTAYALSGQGGTGNYGAITAAAAAPTLPDNFTRANGGLGANWTTITGMSAPQIVSDQVTTTGVSYVGAYWNPSQPSNQTASIVINQQDDALILIYAQMNSSFTQNYNCIWDGANVIVYKGLTSTGASAEPATDWCFLFGEWTEDGGCSDDGGESPSSYKLQITTTGTSPVVVTCSMDTGGGMTPITSFTDSASPYQNPYIGFQIQNHSGTTSVGTFDNH